MLLANITYVVYGVVNYQKVEEVMSLYLFFCPPKPHKGDFMNKLIFALLLMCIFAPMLN